MDRTELLLKEITEANGVSGYETDVRNIMARELEPLCESIESDNAGSVYGVKPGTSDSPRVMVVGHLDEIGFMVKGFTAEGYIKFLPLGGWWGHVALGQRMRIITSKGPVLGVVGSRPPHVLEPEERKNVLAIKDMFIDVGVQEKFDPRKKLGIKMGDPIVPDSEFRIMGNKKMYMSKAFDNRMGCAVAIEVARKLQKVKHPNTLLAAGSVQEEVGLRGAQTIAHAAEPDVCIVCDTGIALDVPPDGFKVEEKIGSGPGVFLYDAGMIPNRKLLDLVLRTAEQKNIPIHLTSMERGATDGGRIHMSRAGVPSIVIGPPVRYIHSHNSVMNRTDFDNTVKLITEVVKKLDESKVDEMTKG